jgi:uncharacterized DUF497 family protein
MYILCRGRHEYEWSEEKYALLREKHGIGFADCVSAVQAGKLLADLEHPNRERYPRQRIMIVMIDEYAWDVPYVRDGNSMFLKTLFPNRKHTARYLGT